MKERIQVGDFIKVKNRTDLYGEVETVSKKFITVKLVDEKGVSKGHLKLEGYKLERDTDGEIFAVLL